MNNLLLRVSRYKRIKIKFLPVYAGQYFFRIELISIELIFLTIFRRSKNTVSKIICLVFAKWSFRLIKPLESSTMQFHAVAFIARSTESLGPFYLICAVKVIYMLHATKDRDSQSSNVQTFITSQRQFAEGCSAFV